MSNRSSHPRDAVFGALFVTGARRSDRKMPCVVSMARSPRTPDSCNANSVFLIILPSIRSQLIALHNFNIGARIDNIQSRLAMKTIADAYVAATCPAEIQGRGYAWRDPRREEK